LLGGEVDAAGREGVADEEIVAFAAVEVLAVLEVRVLGGGERQLHRLRDHLAFQRGDGGLDGDRDLGRAGAARGAFQAGAGMRRAQLDRKRTRLNASHAKISYAGFSWE